jgi:RNA polymerase sigma factor (TIGR02999 family)
VSARRAARFGATRILRRGAVVAGSVAMSDAPSSSEPVAGDITLLIQRAGAGDLQAADRILPLVYDELRKLAAAKMARETPGLTLQPTALVHEAWLRLGGDQQPQWKNRAHFFAAAAEGMRRILIDNARRRRAQRHGGALEKVSANATGFDVAAPQLDDDQLIRLDEALAKLAAHDARKADIVKHHYFVGLTVEEAAEVMGITARTAHRDWAYARVWLFNEMKAAQG